VYHRAFEDGSCAGRYSDAILQQVHAGNTAESVAVTARDSQHKEQMMGGFVCKQCGRCCLYLDGFETTCSQRDIARWERNGRYDILAWVETYNFAAGLPVHEIWIHPRTGNNVTRCPWLRKLPGDDRYACRINALKPDRCRNWQPDSVPHAREIGCRGFARSGRAQRKVITGKKSKN
jgi:hypothetical protein